MRITNNMLVNNMINHIGRNLVRMDKYQNQLATGKKIQMPSDDPVVAARALKLRTDVSEIEQYKRNIKDAQSWLDITESTLANIGDVLHRTRELAVQGANGTNTPDETKKIAEEVKQLKTQLIHLGNTTYAGRYIFSGFSTDKKLINDMEDSPDFGKFSINSNTINEKIKYEIGIGDDININVPGGELFNGGYNAVGSSSGVIGNNDVLSLVITNGVNDGLNITVDGVPKTVTIPEGAYANINMLAMAVQKAVNDSAPPTSPISVNPVGSRLEFISGNISGAPSIAIDPASSAASNLGVTSTTPVTDKGQTGALVQDVTALLTALNNGDHNAIGRMISAIDGQISNLLRIRADVGARQNRLELTANRMESDSINFTKLMSDNEDVDIAETIMSLKSEENVYRASLSGGARIIQPSLVDFLR